MSPKKMGATAQPGPISSHVTMSDGVLTITGTIHNDAIHRLRPEVTIQGIGTLAVDVASAREIRIHSFAGNDSIAIDSDPSVPAFIYGGGGAETISGGAGNDFIDGGNGHDDISGDAGDDYLVGVAGSDDLQGNDGNDRLEGGLRNDSLWGGAAYDGAGDDTFVFRRD